MLFAFLCGTAIGYASLEARLPVPVVSELTLVEVSVFPNPFVDRLEIKANAVVSHYRIYNILGTLVKEGRPNDSSIVVDTSKFSSGIYLLEVHSGSVRRSLKLVKR
jgi:hypothetical protein